MTADQARDICAAVRAGEAVSVPCYVDALRVIIALGYSSVSAFLSAALPQPVIAHQSADWCGNP